MPRLFQHGRTLARFISRWRISDFTGARARIFEVPSWVQGMVRLDRDWDQDERQIWGFTADAVSTTVVEFPSVAIFAGNREVHLRKIDFAIRGDAGAVLSGREIDLLTPPDGYNPVIVNPGEFFPFLQTTPVAGVSSPLSLPRARVVGGHQTGLMQVLIGDVLVNPAIGPRYLNHIALGGPDLFTTVLDWNDPPVILPPGRVFAVQFFNPGGIAPGERVFVNLFLAEREAA